MLTAPVNPETPSLTPALSQPPRHQLSAGSGQNLDSALLGQPWGRANYFTLHGICHLPEAPRGQPPLFPHPESHVGGIFFNTYILLKYSWLTMFQVHSKVIQLYKYTYIIFEIIFHHRLLQDIDYSPLCHRVNLCCFMHYLFFN